MCPRTGFGNRNHRCGCRGSCFKVSRRPKVDIVAMRCEGKRNAKSSGKIACGGRGIGGEMRMQELRPELRKSRQEGGGIVERASVEPQLRDDLMSQ